MFVPQSDLDDTIEVNAFSQCVTNFLSDDRQLHPHPGFGKMNRKEFTTFHAAHAAHHLSFLEIAEPHAKDTGEIGREGHCRTRGHTESNAQR